MERTAELMRQKKDDDVRRHGAIDLPTSNLCQACITGRYPTPHGQKLYEIALTNVGKTDCSHRTYEVQHELTFAR